MSTATPLPTETQSERFNRKKDAAKRAEAISALVERGRANGHAMAFAARVAAAYAATAKGGAR